MTQHFFANEARVRLQFLTEPPTAYAVSKQMAHQIEVGLKLRVREASRGSLPFAIEIVRREADDYGVFFIAHRL